MAFDLQDAVRRELESAPSGFRDAFGFMGRDWQSAERAFAGELWPGTWESASAACRAYCLRELNRHDEAIGLVRQIKSEGLAMPWLWYLHHTLAHSLNMVDDLPAAADATFNSLTYFRGLGAADEVAHFLSLRANILKQQAFHLSKDPSTYSAAQPLLAESVEALAESMMLLPPEGDELAAELDGLGRIAARIRFDGSLLKLDHLPRDVREMVQRRFGSEAMARSTALLRFNAGVDALRQKNHLSAADLFAEAFEIMPAEAANDRAFRALIAYQRGVALLRGAGLENLSLKSVPDEELPTVVKIREIWSTALGILPDLDKETFTRFNEDIAPGATAAMVNDPLMRGEIAQRRGIDLANGGQKAEAAKVLLGAVDLLDPRIQGHDRLIAETRTRLATLLSDLGDRRAAADHARWVLEHCPPESDFMKEAFFTIAGVDKDSWARNVAQACVRAPAATTVDAPDYLVEADQSLRSDAIATVAGLQMPAQSLQALAEQGRIAEVRDLLIVGLGVPSYAKKVSAFALGQLGDPAAIEALEQYRRSESARGQVEALSAAIVTIREMPRTSTATEAERRKAVENAYHDRPLRSQAESPTRHLREPRPQQPAVVKEQPAQQAKRGLWGRLFKS